MPRFIPKTKVPATGASHWPVWEIEEDNLFRGGEWVMTNSWRQYVESRPAEELWFYCCLCEKEHRLAPLLLKMLGRTDMEALFDSSERELLKKVAKDGGSWANFTCAGAHNEWAWVLVFTDRTFVSLPLKVENGSIVEPEIPAHTCFGKPSPPPKPERKPRKVRPESRFPCKPDGECDHTAADGQSCAVHT